MAQFYINPGELRTPIRLQNKVVSGTGINKVTSWVDIGNQSSSDPPRYVKSKWVSLNGMLAYLADSVQAKDIAEVTLRYVSEITQQTQIVNDGIIYQIVDVGDPDQHKRWLVLRVKAAVNA